MDFWTALSNATAPQAPALSTASYHPQPEGRKKPGPKVGYQPKPKNMGPDAGPKAPKTNPYLLSKGNKTGSKLKRGIPTVSKSVADILDGYQSLEDIENYSQAVRMARNLKRRGYSASTDVNVLLPPGSVKGAPTVSRNENGASVAEISAEPTLIGQTAEMPDPRTVARLEETRATTKAHPRSVAPSSMHLNVGLQGDAAAVNETRAPRAAAELADSKQVPSQTPASDAVGLSLFKRR